MLSLYLYDLLLSARMISVASKCFCNCRICIFSFLLGEFVSLIFRRQDKSYVDFVSDTIHSLVINSQSCYYYYFMETKIQKFQSLS